MTLDKFESKVERIPESGCWIWMGGISEYGYGRTTIPATGHRQLLTHRISWNLYRGEIPDDLMVCHTCDIRCCVNPNHLWLGTSKDNCVDAVKKGKIPKHEKHACAKLTAKQVEEIRIKLSQKISYRKIANEYGVEKTAIRYIKLGITWSSLTWASISQFP